VRPGLQLSRIEAMSGRTRTNRLGYVFLAPGVTLVLALSIFPLLMSLSLTFVYWDMANPISGIRWAGLDQWGRLFGDEHFFIVLRNTILYVVIGIPVQYGLGLMLARALDRQIRARNTLRVFFLVPMMLSPVVVAFVVGRVMFNEAVGPINAALKAMGAAPVPWLSDSFASFITVLLVDTWQWTPFFMLVMLAGLSALPQEVEEAARLDTTSDTQAFWRVIFPMLAPWTITAVLIRSVEMLKIVDVIVVLTNGGPGIATESLTLYAYRTGVVNFDLGYAAALSFTLLILAIVSAMGLLFATRRFIARAT
jgi:multiple sugar transport system permease protein